MEPRITFGIIVLNGEPFIRYCLRQLYPHAHEITRAVGAEDELEPSIEMGDLVASDKFLLCSDGLYGEVSEGDISQLLAQDDLGQACRAMVELAKENGAHDNVTVVAVEASAAK